MMIEIKTAPVVTPIKAFFASVFPADLSFFAACAIWSHLRGRRQGGARGGVRETSAGVDTTGVRRVGTVRGQNRRLSPDGDPHLVDFSVDHTLQHALQTPQLLAVRVWMPRTNPLMAHEDDPALHGCDVILLQFALGQELLVARDARLR